MVLKAHFVNFTKDGAESRRQRVTVALFGEGRVARLCAFETSFGAIQKINSHGPVPDMVMHERVVES